MLHLLLPLNKFWRREPCVLPFEWATRMKTEKLACGECFLQKRNRFLMKCEILHSCRRPINFHCGPCGPFFSMCPQFFHLACFFKGMRVCFCVHHSQSLSNSLFLLWNHSQAPQGCAIQIDEGMLWNITERAPIDLKIGPQRSVWSVWSVPRRAGTGVDKRSESNCAPSHSIVCNRAEHTRLVFSKMVSGPACLSKCNQKWVLGFLPLLNSSFKWLSLGVLLCSCVKKLTEL